MSEPFWAFVLPTEVGGPDDFYAVDDLLIGGNGGVRFLYDFSYPWSYPGGEDPYNRPAAGPPADGAVVRDVTGNADGVIRKAGSLGYAGGGIDLSVATGRDNYLEIPASVNAGLFADQEWVEAHYFMWPDSSLWTGHSGSVYAPVFNSSGTDANPIGFYGSTPERVWMGVQNTGTVQAVFQQVIGSTAGTSYKALLMGSSGANTHRGRLTQVAAWRLDDGTIAARLRSTAGTTLLTGTATKNTSDYSTSRDKVGVTNVSQWEDSGLDLSASPFRLYRGFIEDLSVSGRDPVAVLDADYARVIARGDFS